MEKCSPKITRYELPIGKVEEFLNGSGGTIQLSTTPYAVDLAQMEEQYWRFHSPWGNPGDKVYILEKFRVERLCQSAEGYCVTYKYEDGKEVSVSSTVPVAVTAKGLMLPGNTAPDSAIRLKMVIQDVQVTGDCWLFTLAKEVEIPKDEPSNGTSM